jgi:hypothetical protein
MTTYDATVTLSIKSPKRLLGYPGMKVVYGSVDITNYHQTHAEITDITGLFKTSAYKVIPSATEKNANIATWNYTDKCVVMTVASTGAELATDQDGGVVDFVAVGI